jgi:hypothetical protein
MKMLLEYLERAVELEKLAATEPNGAFRAELWRQASAYRELAAKRAEEYGLPPPSPPNFLAPRSKCCTNFAQQALLKLIGSLTSGRLAS